MDIITKGKVTSCVGAYRDIYKAEHQQFCKEQIERKKNLKNEWSELPGEGFVVRELNRIPETLHTIFKKVLTQDEYKHFQEETSQIWFGNEFKEFNMAERGKL